jgi:hypothetical protein
MTPEGKIKARVKQEINKFGPRVWKFMPVQTGYGSPSLDFMFCVNGYFVAIETKAKCKKLTTRQELTKAAIENAGGLAFVVDDEESLQRAMDWVKRTVMLWPHEHHRI